MPYWLAGVAIAGIRQEVEALARQGADVVLTCASLGPVLDAAERFATRMPSERAAELVGMLDGARSAVSPDVPFSFAMWQRESVSIADADFYAELRFTTTLDAMSLAHAFAGQAEVRPHARGAEMGDQLVEVQDGRAIVRDAADRPTGAEAVDATVLRPLPDAGGCLAIMRLPADDEFPGGIIGLHLPLERGGALRFAILPSGKPVDASLIPRASPHEQVNTLQIPAALVRFGVRVADLDPKQLGMDKREARQTRRLQRHFPFDGITVAMFPSAGLLAGPVPDIAVDVPLSEEWSAARTSRKARRITRRLLDEAEIERSTPSSFVVHSAGLFATDLYVSGRERGLRLATSQALLDDISTPGGRPWLAPDEEGSLFYMRLDPALFPMLQAPAGAELSMSFDLDGELIIGHIALSGDPDALAEWTERIQQLAQQFAGSNREGRGSRTGEGDPPRAPGE